MHTKGGAYLGQRGDRRGVPRADVRVERRRRGERLRAEPHAVDADGRALACVGADACAPKLGTRAHTRAHTDAARVLNLNLNLNRGRRRRNALACVGADACAPKLGTRAHTRAHTDAARERVCAAGLHRRSVHRCSQTRMDIDTCMQDVYIHCVCACCIDGWPYEESVSHSHRCRVFVHRQRPNASARVRKNTHAYPFTCHDFASIDIHIHT
jgi:hypothetical protein